MKLEEINRKLSETKPFLQGKFAVKQIGIFGSYSRNEQNEESDIDVLVEFSKPVGFFHFIRLENYLSELLGIHVDLVTESALKPRIKDEILQQLILI
jgi:predicted nucleotidyltransferase